MRSAAAAVLFPCHIMSHNGGAPTLPEPGSAHFTSGICKYTSGIPRHRNTGCAAVLFPDRQVFFQCLDISPESLRTRRCDFAGGARHLASEPLLYGYISRFGQFVNLHTQVSRGGAGLFLEVVEIGLLHPGQYRHDGQPQL